MASSREELIRKIHALPVIGPEISVPFANFLTTLEADIREQAGIGAKAEVTPMIIGIAGLSVLSLLVAWSAWRATRPRRAGVAGLLPPPPVVRSLPPRRRRGWKEAAPWPAYRA
jgi:hypothetical protein